MVARRRPASPTCSTSTCTSSTRSPARRPSTACAWPAARVRRPDLTVATEDHNVPTDRHRPAHRRPDLAPSRSRCCGANCAEFGITDYPMGDPGQGIVHVIGPEQGLTLPGMTIVCGDSHTATHGAFGALAFGIGTSEVEHVLATQTLPQQRPEHDGGHRRRRPARRRHRQGRHPRHHRPHRHRRRHRLRHRVPRLGHPRAVDGGPHDGLQHVDRGRRQGRPRRPRRHHVRLPRGPAPRAEGRGLGAGARRLARAAHRRRRRPSTRRSCSTPPTLAPHVTLGHQPGAGRSPIDGAVPDPDTLRRRRRPRDGRPGARVHGPHRRHADARRSPSTPCSSARAPTAASRTCGPPPRWPTAARSRSGCGRMVVPGLATP